MIRVVFRVCPIFLHNIKYKQKGSFKLKFKDLFACEIGEPVLLEFSEDWHKIIMKV